MKRNSKIVDPQELARIVGGWQGRSYVFVQAFRHKKSGFGKGFFKAITSGWR